MPLTKRSISPVRISLHRLPPNVRENELECVANGTLANLVRQLSSLSRHAEDIFGELFREAVKIEHKTSILFNRIDRIALKVTQLDSNVEEVSLQDLHLRKPFKSSSLIDQQSLSRQTMPVAMTECYAQCDRPPDLDKLNPYRTDNKLALKFYTDPDYFFELWRQEMLKDADHPKKKEKTSAAGGGRNLKNREKKRKSPRQPQDHRQKFYDRAVRTGEYIQQTPTADYSPHVGNGMVRPESLELRQQPTPPQLYDGSSGYGSVSSAAGIAANHSRIDFHQSQQRYSAANSAVSANSAPNYAAAGILSRNLAQQLPTRGDYAFSASSANSAAGSTPTLRECDQISPQSVSSSDSSGPGGGISSRAGSRPAQPPPAPPPPTGPVRQAPPIPPTETNGDVRQQFSRMQIAVDRVLIQSSAMSAERSVSPDLPPPPPPIIYDGVDIGGSKETSPIAAGNGYKSANSAAPPPPPPPPPNTGSFQSSADQTSASKPSAKSASSANADSRIDARSELLRAIREGFQLKKVDRKEEKEREENATKGHDVAAILKRRMEDVMGRGSESEESASDFDDDDWDD